MESQFDNASKKIRNRSTIVCTNCKKRKTKCDKKQPCSKCIISKKAHSCTYLDPVNNFSNLQQTILRQSNSYEQTVVLKPVAKSPASPMSNGSTPPIMIANNNSPISMTSSIMSNQPDMYSLSSASSSPMNNHMSPNSPYMINTAASTSPYYKNISSPLANSPYESMLPCKSAPSPATTSFIPKLCEPNNSKPLMIPSNHIHSFKSNFENINPYNGVNSKPNLNYVNNNNQLLDVNKLTTKLNNLNSPEKVEMLSFLDRLIKVYNNQIPTDTNRLLNSKVWLLVRNSPNTPRTNKISCPLVYPSTFWGRMDFPKVGTELFQPLLDLYFEKWESVSNSGHVLTSTTRNINENEINHLLIKLKSFFITNINAVVEIIIFFKTYISPLLFNSFIPTEVIDHLLQHFLNIETLKKIHCDDNIFELSFVFSILDVFNQFDKKGALAKYHFKYQLDYSITNYTDISLTLLNYIDHLENKNFIGILASILFTWSSLYLNNNAFAGISGEYIYPFFKKLLGILYQLGYNLQANESQYVFKINSFESLTIKQDSIWKLWNHLQFIDAFLAIRLGTPLLINYDYCDEFHLFNPNDPNELLHRDLILAIREFAYLLNSKNKSNYRSFIVLEQKFKLLYDRTLRFTPDFKNENYEFITINNTFKFQTKIEIMKCWFLANVLLTVSLRKENLNEVFKNLDVNSIEFRESEKIRETSKVKTYMILLMCFKFIQVLSTNKVIDQSILLTIRRDLLPWFSFPILCTLDCMISDNDNAVSMNSDYFTKPNTIPYKDDLFKIDLNDLEQLMIHNEYPLYRYETNKFNFTHYYELSIFLTEVYEKAKSNKMFSSCFDFYIKSKVLAFAVYTILVFTKLKNKNFNENKNNTYSNKCDLYNILSQVVQLNMVKFQKRPGKGSALMKLLLNDEYDEYGNNKNGFNDPFTNIDGYIDNNNGLMDGLNSDGFHLTNPIKSSSSSTSSTFGSSLPPDEVLGMIRLFSNDERFTSIISRFDYDLKTFTSH